jgi:hypothetical protein
MTQNSDHHDVRRQPSGSSALAARFSKFAQATAQWTEHPIAFLLAVAVIVVWIITGPIFGYSDTWQLVINTGTTIVTFLMVFVLDPEYSEPRHRRRPAQTFRIGTGDEGRQE